MKQTGSAGLTDIGRVRKVNQDAFFLDDGLGLYVVADGMGGHKAGEVASRLVVDTLRDSFSIPGEESLPADSRLSPNANRLVGAIYDANRIVYQASLETEAYQGMGSTVSAIFFSGNTVIAANVGDSPIFLIHKNTLQEISEPHTLEAELRTSNSAEIPSQYHHILTRAIGVRETVDAHVCEIPGFAGDTIVMGSDGLCNMVTQAEILEAATATSPETACRHLVMLANDRGGEDNITVLITKIRSDASQKGAIIRPFMHFFKQAFSSFRSKRHNLA